MLWVGFGGCGMVQPVTLTRMLAAARVETRAAKRDEYKSEISEWFELPNQASRMANHLIDIMCSILTVS